MKKKMKLKKIAEVGAAVLIAGMATAGIVAAPRDIPNNSRYYWMNTNDMKHREPQRRRACQESYARRRIPALPGTVTNTEDYIYI